SSSPDDRSQARIRRARTHWDRGLMPPRIEVGRLRESIPGPHGSTPSLPDHGVDRRQDRLDRPSISSRSLAEGRSHSPTRRVHGSHGLGPTTVVVTLVDRRSAPTSGSNPVQGASGSPPSSPGTSIPQPFDSRCAPRKSAFYKRKTRSSLGWDRCISLHTPRPVALRSRPYGSHALDRMTCSIAGSDDATRSPRATDLAPTTDKHGFGRHGPRTM